MPLLEPVALPNSSAITTLLSIPLTRGVAMVPIVGDDVVLWPQGRNGTNRDGLFTDVEVKKAQDVALHVLTGALLLEQPHQHHLTVEFQELGFISAFVQLHASSYSPFTDMDRQGPP